MNLLLLLLLLLGMLLLLLVVLLVMLLLLLLCERCSGIAACAAIAESERERETLVKQRWR